uniref:PsbP C-terminal domain-containing protein n=1 Tax=Ananas comosus var. bracteatus TaxID=296719 RepID=A0A6V7PD16_ANACO|nr:unnamed protein product [Ananas comosus var. bracteatus]
MALRAAGGVVVVVVLPHSHSRSSSSSSSSFTVFPRIHISIELGGRPGACLQSSRQSGIAEVTGPPSSPRPPIPSPRAVSDPVAAFGPPGSNGELNVSVIVSPSPSISRTPTTNPRTFKLFYFFFARFIYYWIYRIEAFGGPKEVGEAVLRRIAAASRRGSEVRATLIDASVREDPDPDPDPAKKVKYYKLEFAVEGPSFRRHNVALCCARDGKLYTLNAQAPESAWPGVRHQFYEIADSFTLTET